MNGSDCIIPQSGLTRRDLLKAAAGICVSTAVVDWARAHPGQEPIKTIDAHAQVWQSSGAGDEGAVSRLLERMQSSGVSLMPEGLEKTIPPQEMADLIAFIKGWRYLDGKTPLGK